MTPQPLSLKTIVLAIGDIIVFALALAAAIFIRYGGVPDPVTTELYFFASPFLMLLWIAGLAVFGLYDIKMAKNEPRFFERLSRAVVFDFVVTVLLFYLIPEFRLRPLATLALIFFFLAAFLFGWRKIYNTILSRRMKERVLFWGLTPEVAELAGYLTANPQLGFVPAIFEENGTANPGPRYRPFPTAVPSFSGDLRQIVTENRINEIIIAHDTQSSPALAKTLFKVVPLGVGIIDLRRFYESVTGRVPISLITETWFLENLVGTRRPRYEFAKRILDLTLAAFMGALSLLFIPFIAVAIVFSTLPDIANYKTRRARKGDGMVFFRQPRVGKNGQVFNFLKFRSQRLGAEKLGQEKGPPEGNDPRSYPAGDLLRKTYLDELPQLWNVIRGEMSFVGPRPERPEFVAELEKKIPFYRMRELVLPGITGWAQTNMENDASVSDAPEKIQYDLYYIKNRSVFLDLSILMKTTLKLLQRSGR